MKKLFSTLFFFLVILFSACGKSGGYKIALDPSFYRENFQKKDPYVLGFTEEFFLQVSEMENVNFDLFTDNWDTLLEDLRADKYDAIVSSLPPYNFNEALYDFSESFLEIGPVLVVPKSSKIKRLEDMKDLAVGVVENSAAEKVVQLDPDIMVRSYDSVSEVFFALFEENVNAVVVDKIDAIAYADERVRILDKSLTNEALRFVTKQDENGRLLRYFNNTIRKMKKKSSFTALKKKWDLSAQ